MNAVLHIGLALVLGAEVAGIAWLSLDASDPVRMAISAALFCVTALVGWRISFAPERATGTELQEAVVDRRLYGVPRWWGVVPLAVALLGLTLLWMVVRG